MELAQPVLRGWSYVDARVTALIRRRGHSAARFT
jgi:hypothetical protein